MQPILADRVSTLMEWKQIAVLSVESSRVTRWYRPGLLLIGDAAHVMSPVGGVGINYAVQDAVEAANLLAAPLAGGSVELQHLAAVQSARELPVKVIQFIQKMIQNRVLTGVLTSKRTCRISRYRCGFSRRFLSSEVCRPASWRSASGGSGFETESIFASRKLKRCYPGSLPGFNSAGLALQSR